MPSYNLSILDLEVSFTTQADHDRVQAAKELIEERHRELTQHGRRLSKEKCLTFLALALADDLLQTCKEMEDIHQKIGYMVEKLDTADTTENEQEYSSLGSS